MTDQSDDLISETQSDTWIERFLAFALLAAVRLLATLPLWLRRFIGYSGGWIVGFILLQDRQVVRHQVQRFLPDSWSRTFPNRVFASIGLTVLESINLTPLLKRKALRFPPESEATLRALATLPRGCITLTAHIGNWELLAATIVERNIDLYAISRMARLESVQEILSRVRKKHDVSTLWRRQASPRTIIRLLSSNSNLVAALIDQDTRVRSVASPFFGELACTPSGLVEMAQRFDLPIITAFSVRMPDGTYEAYIDFLPFDSGIDEVLAEFHRRLERVIRAHPEQWVWFHKRWRTRGTTKRLNKQEYFAWLQHAAHGAPQTDRGAVGSSSA